MSATYLMNIPSQKMLTCANIILSFNIIKSLTQPFAGFSALLLSPFTFQISPLTFDL